MNAKDIVEKFKNVLLSEESNSEAPKIEVKSETSEIEVKEQEVVLSEEVKEVENTESETQLSEEVDASYDDKKKLEEDEIIEEVKEDPMSKYATKEDLEKAMAEMKALVDSLKMQEDMPEVPEQLSSQEPAVEPIAHDPESSVEKKSLNLYAQNRTRTLMDRVLSKIS
jgi:hypothetical protein